MYAYEERIRAVMLYIKLEKRLKATILQMGCLTKNSLIGWYREYEESRDL
jgi:transposase-like protein